jgi:hypothetical protein
MSKVLDNGVVRDMTEAELTQLEIDREAYAAQMAVEQAAAALRASALAKLAALGLTEAEIKALVG